MRNTNNFNVWSNRTTQKSKVIYNRCATELRGYAGGNLSSQQVQGLSLLGKAGRWGIPGLLENIYNTDKSPFWCSQAIYFSFPHYPVPSIPRPTTHTLVFLPCSVGMPSFPALTSQKNPQNFRTTSLHQRADVKLKTWRNLKQTNTDMYGERF